MLANLQSLRFVFALMIFFHHYMIDGAALFQAGGTCGVSFFIILSGFVMSVGYKEKVLSPSFSFKKYIIKRFAKLYPLHLVCLLGVIILNGNNYGFRDWISIIPSVFLLQSWIPYKGVYFAGNAVAWCLSDMFFFYIVFPYLIRLKERLSRNKKAIFISLFLIAYILVVCAIPEKLQHPILYISPLFRLIDFVIGIYLFDLFCWFTMQKGIQKVMSFSCISKTFIELSSIILVTAAVFAYPYIPKSFVYASYYWLTIPVFIIVFAIFSSFEGGLFSSFLKTRVMMFLGEISFTFYMIHLLVINIIILPPPPMCALSTFVENAIQLCVSLSLTIVVSIFVNRFIEKPLSAVIIKCR